jgi:hypothetical protein
MVVCCGASRPGGGGEVGFLLLLLPLLEFCWRDSALSGMGDGEGVGRSTAACAERLRSPPTRDGAYRERGREKKFSRKTTIVFRSQKPFLPPSREDCRDKKIIKIKIKGSKWLEEWKGEKNIKKYIKVVADKIRTCAAEAIRWPKFR